MIEKFQFYVDAALVKRTSPNKEQASALMQKAHERLSYVREQKITKSSAPFVFEDIYESLREASQALMELRGYKPYSHEAQISFLREFCKFPEHIISTFDRFRILRNKSMYGAGSISPETCGEALAFAASLLPELKKALERESKG